MDKKSLKQGEYLRWSFPGLPDVEARRYTPHDVEMLFDAVTESVGHGFTEWMPWAHKEYSLQESQDYLKARDAAWEKGEDYALAVFSGEKRRYVGGVGLNAISAQHRYANLGYWIRRSEWGHGYAASATLCIARFAFEYLGLVRTEIVIAVGNDRSCRVADKAGAHHEGVLRNRLLLGGKPCDAHMYSLIP